MAEDRNYEQELESLISDARNAGEDIAEFETLIVEVRASMEKLQNVQERMEEMFFSNVGQAISYWSAMENILVGIVGILLGTRLEKAGLMLYSVQNFHVWLNIIDELFIIDPRYSEFRSRWTDISDQLRTLNDTRVRLAHHTSWHSHRERGNPSLRPSALDARSKSRKYRPLEAEQIVDFIGAMNRAVAPSGDIVERA